MKRFAVNHVIKPLLVVIPIIALGEAIRYPATWKFWVLVFCVDVLTGLVNVAIPNVQRKRGVQ